jgi:hypothetical protein
MLDTNSPFIAAAADLGLVCIDTKKVAPGDLYLALTPSGEVTFLECAKLSNFGQDVVPTTPDPVFSQAQCVKVAFA